MLPIRFRRGLSVAIPILTAALLFGMIEGIFKIKMDENLINTGITLATIFAILNAWVAWLAFKHQVP